MTKTAALREFRIYMHDVRVDARREGYRPQTNVYWNMFVDMLREEGRVAPETAHQWIMRGPR